MADKIKLNVRVDENMPIPVDVKAALIQQAVNGALKSILESQTYEQVELKLSYNSYKMNVEASMSYDIDQSEDLYGKIASKTGLPRQTVKEAAFYTTYAVQKPSMSKEESEKLISNYAKRLYAKERDEYLKGHANDESDGNAEVKS